MLVHVGVEARRLERDERSLVRVRLREHQLQLVRQPFVLFFLFYVLPLD